MKSKDCISAVLSAAGIFAPALIILCICGCTKEGPAGPPGEKGSHDLMDPNVRPEVVSSTPANNSAGPFELYAPGPSDYLPHFILEFNKLISTNVLPLSVTVSGFDRKVYVIPSPNIFYPFGKGKTSAPASNGPFNNIFAFSIVDSASGAFASYDIGRTYTVTVDTSLYDISGNHPSHSSSFSFTPEPYFRLVVFIPGGGSMNVYRYTQPYAYFNAPINKSILNHLHLSPGESGFWGLYKYDSDSVTAIFTLVSPLAFHTQYTLSVDAGATDAAGDQIRGSSQTTFTTATFSVSNTYPSNGSSMVDPIVQIQLNFSDPADTASIRTAFSISPATAGSLVCFPSYCYFAPAGTLIPETQYTVTMSTALKSAEGFHLEFPYTLRFTTAPFRITSTDPFNGFTNVNRLTGVYIYCNMVIDTGSVRSSFHISPAVTGTFGLYTSSNQFAFYPSALLDTSKTYTVTIDSTLRSFNGYMMTAPYKFSFTTSNN